MSVTLQELLNGVIYMGTLAGALAGIGLLLNWTVVRPLRGFLRGEIVAELVSIKDALEDNTTTNAMLQRQLHDHINDDRVHVQP